MPGDQRSFVDRLIAQRGCHIHKLTGKDKTGRKACYFVMVEPSRERAFLAAMARKEVMELEDYGLVIASNYGDAPSGEVKAKLGERYGFEA